MNRSQSTGFTQILLLILGCVVGALGIVLFQHYFSPNTDVKEPVAITKTNQADQSTCPKYNFDMSQDQYLRKYTVKPGDSLLGIAVKELGDQNRIDEIVYLNLSKFPVTVSPSPLIEVGWTLYLPPDWLKSSSGYLKGLQGKVMSVNESNIILTFDKETNRMYGDKYYLHYDNSINYIPKVGDCVTVIMDTSNPGGRTPKILKISPQ